MHLKKNNSLEQIFKKIELEVQDDMAMFLEFGETYFTLEELERLYYNWERNYLRTDKWKGRSILLCSGSFLLIPLSYTLLIAGFNSMISKVLLLCFPILFFTGIGIFLFLYLRYGRGIYNESIGRRLRFAIRNKRKRSGYRKDYEQ